jgi:hypothetical protein
VPYVPASPNPNYIAWQSKSSTVPWQRRPLPL